jgi:hypothetical protein
MAKVKEMAKIILSCLFDQKQRRMWNMAKEGNGQNTFYLAFMTRLPGRIAS